MARTRPVTIVPRTWPDFHESTPERLQTQNLDGTGWELTRILGPCETHHEQRETSTKQNLTDPIELLQLLRGRQLDLQRSLRWVVQKGAGQGRDAVESRGDIVELDKRNTSMFRPSESGSWTHSPEMRVIVTHQPSAHQQTHDRASSTSNVYASIR